MSGESYPDAKSAEVLGAELRFVEELFELMGYERVNLAHVRSILEVFGLALPDCDSLVPIDGWVDKAAFAKIWARALVALTPRAKLELHLGVFAAGAAPRPRQAAGVSAAALLDAMVAAEALRGDPAGEAADEARARLRRDKQKYIDFARGQLGGCSGETIPAGHFLAAAGLDK